MKILKKCFFVLGLGAIGLGAVMSSTACSNESETQTMINLFNSNYDQKKEQINDANSYFNLWKKFTTSDTRDNITKARECLEYSLYLPYLFETGITIIDDSETDPDQTIKLKPDESIWNLFKNDNLQLLFLTGSSNIALNDDGSDSLLLSYTGYLHITVNNSMNLLKGSDSITLSRGSVIEIIFSFANTSFVEGDVGDDIRSDGDTWYSQTICKRHPFVGNQIGSSYIYNENQLLIGSSSIEALPVTYKAANYFGAYK